MMGYPTGQNLRVLVASREDLREHVVQALPGYPGDHRIFWVSQAELVLNRAPELLPHVILLDQDLRGTETPSLIRALLGHVPRATILLLITPDEPHAANQAVLAGARAFLLKPLEINELTRTLDQVYSEPEAPPAMTTQHPRAVSGHVLTFCAPKGGTGRTTLAINTALGLRIHTKTPVAMVDADYAAPALDVALNLIPEHTVVDLLPRLSQLDEAMVSGMLTVHPSGLHVLLAPPPERLSHTISLPAVQQILVVLRRMFPWVIVDLGLPMDETAFAFLNSADRIIMTVLPEMVGLRNTRLMIEQLQKNGCPEDKIWLVVNRATIAGGVSATDIEKRFEVRVRHCIPDDQVLATRSVNRGMPVMISHKRSRVAYAVTELVQLIRTDPTLGREVLEESNGPLSYLLELLGFRKKVTAQGTA